MGLLDWTMRKTLDGVRDGNTKVLPEGGRNVSKITHDILSRTMEDTLNGRELPKTIPNDLGEDTPKINIFKQ